MSTNTFLLSDDTYTFFPSQNPVFVLGVGLGVASSWSSSRGRGRALRLRLVVLVLVCLGLSCLVLLRYDLSCVGGVVVRHRHSHASASLEEEHCAFVEDQ